jgi:hypothetical protein
MFLNKKGNKMRNLFISYDLYKVGQDYVGLAQAIKALGQSVKVQKSFWFVKSSKTAEEARQELSRTIDNNDSIIVIDTTGNSAAWYGLGHEASNFVNQNWNK